MNPPDDGRGPYRAETTDGGAKVVDGQGRTVMTCSDAASAGHYAVLLNDGYKRGYKDGYRDGRRSLSPAGV